MSESGVARIFEDGQSQVVLLPSAFRLPGDRVHVRRVEGDPARADRTDLDAGFREFDRFADIPFMEEGRQQPPMPEPEALFD